MLQRGLLDQRIAIVTGTGRGIGRAIALALAAEGASVAVASRTMPHWKEQFGLVLTEAMACGVPVIGSDSGAIREVIGDGGLVFAEGHVPELTHCLQALMRSPEQRNTLAERGRRWTIDMYADRQIARDRRWRSTEKC